MILNFIEKYYSNQIKNIKNMSNGNEKNKAIGSLVKDVKKHYKHCINAIATLLGSSWRYIKFCYLVFIGIILPRSKETRGRKNVYEMHPTIEFDIEEIIKDDVCCDPEFKHENRYVRLTTEEIKNKLIEANKYNEETCPSISSIKRILKKLGIKLRKVKKVKPKNKIPETDAIFENVKIRKENCMNDDNCVLISIDTKDRVAIGEYSRNGYSYNEVKALDHDFKNQFVTPFGILDMKTSEPHFYNVESKVTAECMVECIEDFLKSNYIDKYRKFNKLSILSDNGPENNSNRTYYIYMLIKLATVYNIEIELIYYPPYHSKYNPIERLWSRLERVWNGSLLTSIKMVYGYLRDLTWKGKSSTAKEVIKVYNTGLKIKKKELDKLKEQHIVYTEGIEKWSLIIRP